MLDQKRDRLFFAVALGLLVGFSVLAKGAYDLWAATIVQCVVLFMFLGFVVCRRDAFPVRTLGACLLALLGLTISLVGSIKPGDSIWALKDCFFAALVFVLAGDIFESEEALNAFLLIICGVMAVEVGLMVRARLSIVGPNETAGTLVNANVAAFFFLPWIPVLVDRIRTNRSKAIWVAALFSAGVGILLTTSYSALGLLCLVLPFFPWIQLKSKSFFVVAGFAVILFTLTLGLRHYQLSQWPGYRISSRFDWWRTGVAMFADHPFVGVGLGNYQSAYLAYKTGPGQNTLFAHNFLVTLLSETGLLGLTAVLAFAVAWSVVVYKSRRWDSRYAFFLGLVLMLLYALYNIGPEYLIGKLMLAIFAGIIIGRGPGMPLRLSVVIVTVAAGLGAVSFLVTPFLASQNLVVAQSQLAAGHLEEAEKSFRTALELDPFLSEAHAGLAQAAFLEGRVNDAISQQQDALRLDKLNQHFMRTLDHYQMGTKSNVF